MNFNFDLPFKIDDNLGSTLLGFRHKFGESLKRGPSALYLKRTFNIGDENAIVIDTQYESKPNVFSIGTKWVSDGFKVALGIDVNTKRFPWGLIPSADFSSKQNVDGWKLNSAAGFNAEKLSVSLSQEVGYGTTAVKIDYDTEKHNPVLQVTQQLDEFNKIIPSISLRNGKTKYGWKRNWEGGSLDTTIFPGDKVTVEWADVSDSGVWRTKAAVPVGDLKGTTITVTRDWKY